MSLNNFIEQGLLCAADAHVICQSAFHLYFSCFADSYQFVCLKCALIKDFLFHTLWFIYTLTAESIFLYIPIYLQWINILILAELEGNWHVFSGTCIYTDFSGAVPDDFPQ